ncbi:FtsX-like permease family protein [Streptomyces sp. NPDC026672]|uniref:FtsX-like permease family protein n=1 Tax=unclassified Streptomyces TaxID=2593676 RepID=UPI0033FE7A7A
MLVLALRSIRRRPGRFLATLLSAFLGATVVMAFGSLRDTAAQRGLDPASADALGISASVVGGYGSLLVFFAVASALTVEVRRRAPELELLRRAGATPAQLRRMVAGEAVAVALAGTLLAIGPAVLGGRVLLGLFQDGGLVARSADHVFGPGALLTGAGTTLGAAAGAALLALRRAGRAAVRRGRGRTVLAYGALVAGAGSVSATFLFPSTDPALMAAPAYGTILLSVGLALLAPRLLSALLAAPVPAGASGWLAVRTLRRRLDHVSGVLMSLVLFTAVSTATLTMQSVESGTGAARTADGRTVEAVNLTVVGIIAVFVCLMLVNSLYAATVHRGPEFGAQRLAGATPGQVLRAVGVETAVLTAAGVLLGTAAALAGIVPFTVVRTDGTLPGRALGIWLAVAAVCAAVTLGTGLGTARRVLRTPAVAAVASAG